MHRPFLENQWTAYAAGRGRVINPTKSRDAASEDILQICTIAANAVHGDRIYSQGAVIEMDLADVDFVRLARSRGNKSASNTTDPPLCPSRTFMGNFPV
jgi:hypothetical protein